VPAAQIYFGISRGDFITRGKFDRAVKETASPLPTGDSVFSHAVDARRERKRERERGGGGTGSALARVRAKDPRRQSGFIVEKRVGTTASFFLRTGEEVRTRRERERGGERGGRARSPGGRALFLFAVRARVTPLRAFPLLVLFTFRPRPPLPLRPSSAVLARAALSSRLAQPTHLAPDALQRGFIYVFSAGSECPRVAARAALARATLVLSPSSSYPPPPPPPPRKEDFR